MANQPHPSVEQALTEFADAAKSAADAVNKRAGRDIFIATAVAVVLLGVAAVCLLWFKWGLVAVIAAAIAGAQIEMGKVFTRVKAVKIALVPLITGSVLLTVAAYVTTIYPDAVPLVVLLWISGLTIVAILAMRLSGTIEGYVADVTHTLFLFVYPCLLASAVIFMLGESDGAFRVAIFIVAIAAADTGGYLLGVIIGKHPIAPTISPKKSWEGLIGSFLLAGICVVLMTVFMMDQAWWKGLILAVTLVIIGFLGDLVESVIKRDLGVKDMGTLIPGHGGIMDRVDSYILSAYPAWLLMMWLFPSV